MTSNNNNEATAAEAPKKNEYFLIYEDNTDDACCAVTSAEDAVQEIQCHLQHAGATAKAKRVTLQEWVQEQLDWEPGNASHAAAIYRSAAICAAEDHAAEAAKTAEDAEYEADEAEYRAANSDDDDELYAVAKKARERAEFYTKQAEAAKAEAQALRNAK